MSELNFFICRKEFDEFIPENCDLKPAIQVYQHACKFLFVWKKERDKKRFGNLCKYIVSSLESESPKMSYVGVSLNKDYSVSFISHMKAILWKCCVYLDDLQPEFKNDMKMILMYLHTLVSFTSTGTWCLLKAKSIEILRPGMTQLCANILGYLFHRGFYLTLKV